MSFAQELPTSFGQALQIAQKILSRHGELVRRNVVQTEAEQIVIAAFRRQGGKLLTRMELYARLKDRFPEAAGEAVLVMSGARAEGNLLQHVTGTQFFYEHEYAVGPDVLVPRPETELLVSHAIKELGEQFKAPRLGLEIGLGSGAISVELLAHFVSLRMIGSELTDVAAERAQANAQNILGTGGARGAERLRIVRPRDALDVWGPFEALRAQGGFKQAQFLISNPPYVSVSDEIDEEVRQHEPATALFPGWTGCAELNDPLYFYRQITARAAEFLEPAGLIYVEIAHERSAETREVFRQPGWETRIFADLNGRDRFFEVRLPS